MIIVLTFQNPINESVQVGDTVFAISNFSSTGNFMHNNLTNAVEIGPITQLINRDGTDSNMPIEIHADHITTGSINPGDFIMFSKNKAANTSGIMGYYASVKMVNNSKEEIDLFSVGSNITINSN